MMILTAAPIEVGASNGSWIGPLFIGLVALGLDASAVGNNAVRDSVAVIGYYASMTAYARLFGMEDFFADLLTTKESHIIGAFINFVMIMMLIFAMIPNRGGFAGWAGEKINFDSSDSGDNKINVRLLVFTSIAALTTPLAVGTPWGKIVGLFASFAIGFWSAIVTAVLALFGG